MLLPVHGHEGLGKGKEWIGKASSLHLKCYASSGREEGRIHNSPPGDFVLAKRPLCFIGRERSFRFRNRRLFAEELGLGGQGMVASLLGRPSNFSDTCYGLVSPCWQKQREDRAYLRIFHEPRRVSEDPNSTLGWEGRLQHFKRHKRLLSEWLFGFYLFLGAVSVAVPGLLGRWQFKHHWLWWMLVLTAVVFAVMLLCLLGDRKAKQHYASDWQVIKDDERKQELGDKRNKELEDAEKKACAAEQQAKIATRNPHTL